MSKTLKMANGDLYLSEASGVAELLSGPSKVDQELFSLYSTVFDPDRNWGSDFDISRFNSVGSPAEFKALLYARLTEANSRIIAMQAQDPYLDVATEKIRSFSRVEVYIDPLTSAGIFFVVARVGDSNTEVGKALPFSYKPTEIGHVVAPDFPIVQQYKV